MFMKKRGLFFLLVLIAIALVIYWKDKDFPASLSFSGKETVQSVVEQLEEPVWLRIHDDLAKVGFQTYPKELALLAFKEEQRLELYGKKDREYLKIKTYPFTAFSGKLGPKLREGDRQIPEGIYGIEYLNPNSSYHLSIKVNYPNAFDRSKSTLPRSQMGSDIFFHGKNVTIGCIPLGDVAIEELFLVTAKAGAQNVQIIISPRDFRENNRTPQISTIDWEEALYDQIRNALRPF